MNTLQRLSNMICDVTAVSLARYLISEFEELRSTKGFKVSQTSDRQTWSFVRQRIIPLQLSCFYKDWLVPWSPLCFVFLELFPVQNKMAVMSLITFYRSRYEVPSSFVILLPKQECNLVLGYKEQSRLHFHKIWKNAIYIKEPWFFRYLSVSHQSGNA